MPWKSNNAKDDVLRYIIIINIITDLSRYDWENEILQTA